MRKKTLILITLLLLLAGIIGLFTWQHNISDEITVFVIDSGFTPQLRPALRERFPAAVPGHGQLTRDIIARRAGRQVNIRELELRGSGEARRQNFLQHLEYIQDYVAIHSAQKIIVNISLAFEDYDQREQMTVERLAQRGVLIVAAAGNSGDETDFYPAAYRDVFTITGADSGGRLTYATYGENIDLAASGHISRMLPRNFSTFSLARYEMQGTSFAAPRVSGDLARLAAVAEDNYSLHELAGLAQKTAEDIDDVLYDEGKLGAGLFQARQVEKLVAPRIYWRRWAIYVFLALVFPALYLLTDDVKHLWQLRKINRVTGEAELIELVEDGRQQIWDKIKREVEVSSRFSRQEFSRHLLFSDVKQEKKQEYLSRLSGQEIYNFVVKKLIQDEADPEKLAWRLSRSSRDKAIDLCHSVNWKKLLQTGGKDRELRFIIALMREIGLADELVDLAVSVLNQSDDPWLIYYSLRALQQSDVSRHLDLIAEGLAKVERNRHPLYNKEIKILKNKLAKLSQ